MRRRTRKKAEVVDAQSTEMVTTKVTLSGDTIEEDETKTINVEVFKTEPAYVRASAGQTKNLGNYESLRVDVSITMPCYKEVVIDTYEAIADRVSELLYDEIDKYVEGDSDG